MIRRCSLIAFFVAFSINAHAWTVTGTELKPGVVDVRARRNGYFRHERICPEFPAILDPHLLACGHRYEHKQQWRPGDVGNHAAVSNK